MAKGAASEEMVAWANKLARRELRRHWYWCSRARPAAAMAPVYVQCSFDCSAPHRIEVTCMRSLTHKRSAVVLVSARLPSER